MNFIFNLNAFSWKRCSRLWYGEPDAISNAVGYAKFYSRPHDAVIRVCDEAGNAIDTQERTGEFNAW